jgi:hypothetical protein
MLIVCIKGGDNLYRCIENESLAAGGEGSNV